MKSIMQKVTSIWGSILGKAATVKSSEQPSIKIHTVGTGTGTYTVRGQKYKVAPGETLVIPILASDKNVLKFRSEIMATFVPAKSAMSKPNVPVTGLTSMTDLAKKDVKLDKSTLAGSKPKGAPKKAAKQPKEPQAPTLAFRVEAFFKKSKSTKGVRVGQVLEALNLPKEKEAVLRTVMFNLKSKGVLASPAKGLFVRGTK